MIRMLTILLSILLAGTSVSFAQDVAGDARRHLVRGIAAVEIAKNDADLALAVEEFQKAAEIAPNLAPAWFNLGKTQSQLGQYQVAVESYKRFLALAPAGDDADRVRDEIIKLEFKNEQSTKQKSRAGIWIEENGTPYRLVLDGNRITLSTTQYRITSADAVATYPLVGEIPVKTEIPLQYSLELQGDKVKGLWSRPAFPAEKCTVPEDGGEAVGELRDSERTLTLKQTRTRYRAATGMGLLTDDFCAGVRAVEKKEIERKFYGPLAKGGSGVFLVGIHEYWPGGFSAVIFGWSGHLIVAAVKEGSPAENARLSVDDEIMAIDGKAVKSMSATEALSMMRGEPGSDVSFSVKRKKAGGPVTIQVKRTLLPDDQAGWY